MTLLTTLARICLVLALCGCSSNRFRVDYAGKSYGIANYELWDKGDGTYSFPDMNWDRVVAPISECKITPISWEEYFALKGELRGDGYSGRIMAAQADLALAKDRYRFSSYRSSYAPRYRCR